MSRSAYLEVPPTEIGQFLPQGHHHLLNVALEGVFLEVCTVLITKLYMGYEKICQHLENFGDGVHKVMK